MADARAVILGATSALGEAVARRLVARGTMLTLVARDATKLEAVRADLAARGGQVQCTIADLDHVDDHAALVSGWSDVQACYLFYGTLPAQQAAEADWAVAERALHTNFMSAASLLTHVANRFAARGSGLIVVVSSVAGDRGRQSNYVYGAAKGALSLFCQGLRNRLHGAGVQVTTVKPGFIDTPMTADVPKRPAVLWASADRVAADIVRAAERGTDVLYTPWFWRYILLIVRAVPERLFKRLSL